VVSGFWLGLTLGRFLISPVATRLGLSAAGMSAGCLVAVTLAAALVWLLPGAAVAAAGLIALGFFLGPIFPTTMAVVPEVTEDRLVPTAIGFMNAGSVVGGSVLPWLAGAIAQGVGVWSLLPYAVLLALLQSVVWWRMARLIQAPATGGVTRRRPAPRPDAPGAAAGRR
jgi:fucose permease